MAPRRYYTTAEFARLNGISRSTVTRLVDAGRIPARRVGSHRRIFKDDLAAAGIAVPAAGPARLTRAEVIRMAPQIRAAAARHRAGNPRLFGSVGRDESDEVSDVDLLVDLDEDASLLDLAALEEELEALLGRRVDVGPARSLKAGVRERALAEAVPI